jgi:FtsP/CotA-like multicopper oxidase with cupredoxin domain
MGSRTIFSPAKAGYNAATANAELSSVNCLWRCFMASCSLRWLARVLAMWFALPIFASATTSLPPIIANQNHAPAGVLRGGVLSLQLEIAKGEWRPEADGGIALSVYAFAEKAHPLQNPGPLIRVPQGTEIHTSLHNTLAVPVVVHGLGDPGGESAVQVPPRALEQVTFKATTPGLYFYWGATEGEDLKLRHGIDSELTGALVVDPAGGRERDEIFVIEMLSEHAGLASRQTLATINGKSWPYTQHFRYNLGQPVVWRWVNATNEPHALHLHGFYFRIDAINHSGRIQNYKDELRPNVVTQRIAQGETFDMSWSPERPGQWLFHCHMLLHMSPPKIPNLPDLAMRGTLAGSSEHSAMQDGPGMGQLVLGVTVPENGQPAAKVAWHADRKLKLVISERQGMPRYALQLLDDAQAAPPPGKPGLIGPPIVLTRGQPVEIEVVNRLRQPTAIHWHGIELESYYDGVPGWSGVAPQVAPPIAPGTSFVARMTPPRAGTFIYHTHWHDESQLTNGLYGPLIVLPPGEKLDPASDLVFVFSIGDFYSLHELALINGTPQSKTLRLEAGKKYRFRLINISTNNQAMQVSLRNPQGPVEWRVIAKDGADLPLATLHSSKAQLTVSVGETYDVEFSAAAPQDLLLDLLLPGEKIHTAQTLAFMPPHKTAP